MSRLGTNSIGGSNGGPSLADFLTARPSGLLEWESWAVLCQAVQALQDLFLSDGAFGSTCIPLLTPHTLLFSLRGRVKLCPSHQVFGEKPPVHLKGYLAPEYRDRKPFTDTEMEKMWIFALGETLKRATLTSHVATSRLSAELCQLLTDMTRLQATSRASLMHLLDIISNYCVKKQQHRPFSHIVMDLYQETVSALELVIEASWGPPAMPELQPRTINWADPTTENYVTYPRRWVGITKNQELSLPKLTREASTSMEDLSFGRACRVPGNVVRPKSMYVVDSDNNIINSEINVISDNNFFNSPPEQKFYSETVPIGLSSGTTSNKGISNRKLKVRRNPVQRAASRLCKVNNEAHKESCIGPEFVIRSSQSSKQLVMADVKGNNGKTVTVILLDGQKMDVLCNPNATAGQLFEQIIQQEHIEENFIFGLSALISGDFVFLPSDTRISKVFQEENNQGTTRILYLRVRFFLPTLRGFRGNEAKHLLYLQLRRSIIEHQLPCSFSQIVELNGLALQAEFGNYSPKEHGQRDYFLLEHYIPESMSSALVDSDRLRQELIRAHISKTGMDKLKAEGNFIAFAQSLPYYGGHFYTATWMMKDNNHKDIWLYISAQGVNLYERGKLTSPYGPNLYEKFEWRNIQTLCYSKQYLCILPHSDFQSKSKSKLKKYKLKMDQKKSYFTFRLASLHHQFFLRFRTEYISPQTLSQQFGIPLKDIKNEANTIYKDSLANTNLDPLNNRPETEFKIEFTSTRLGWPFLRNMKKAKSVSNFVNEIDQNKENENWGPDYGLILESRHLSGLNSVEKRRGVKMGMRAFVNSQPGLSRSMEAVNAINREYLEEMSLQSVSLNCSSNSVSRPATGKCTPNEAYILDSTIKQSSQLFLPDFHESVSDSLLEKLNELSVVEERVLVNVTITRDVKGSFGLQITEGSDGHVYVQSVIENGPAHKTKNVFRGDQILAVNKNSLLELKYDQALDLLKKSSNKIEFVLARVTSTNLNKTKSTLNISNSDSPVEKHTTENCRDVSNVNKYGLPYHKHIRYELESERDIFNMISKELPIPNFDRSFSKSCTHLDYCQNDKAVVVEMIPKENIDLSKFNSLERNLLKHNEHKRSVALPRTLGVSRRWKGPVKYPVTPVKNVTQLSDSTYLSTSDEEQIFI